MTSDRRPDSVLAAEFALGLLEGEELLAARAREASDEAFAADVARWQAQLAPLADDIDPRTPRAEVWQRIEAELERSADGGEIVALRAKARRWQWIGGLSAAAAVALAVFAFLPLRAPVGSTGNDEGAPTAAAAAPLAASMPIEGTPLRLDFTYLPQSHSLVVAAAGLSADGVHDHEIWLVPADGDLISLGIVTAGTITAHSVPLPVARQIGDGSQLLLTREPLGGKQPASDAGPVVAEARLAAV